MASKLFDDILLDGIRGGKVPARTAEAREWYREQAKGVSRSRADPEKTIIAISQSRVNRKGTFMLGHMYMFGYDPKHKETLPYYDRYPLIFPINNAKGGFLGINFHYLPPILRAKLMDQLYTVLNNKRFDESTRIRASYKMLNGITKFKEFKPCVKHYLSEHVRTKPAHILPSEWDIALFLPSQRFVGATANKVYTDSRRIIRG